jgi:hypothetical protein
MRLRLATLAVALSVASGVTCNAYLTGLNRQCRLGELSDLPTPRRGAPTRR